MTDLELIRFLLTAALANVGTGELPWSDDELENAIARFGGVNLAAAFLLELVAARIATGAKSIKTFDLDVSVDTTQAARVLLDLAARYRADADPTVGDPATVSLAGRGGSIELARFGDVAPWT